MESLLPQKPYVVRCDRTKYQREDRPDFNEVLEDATKGYETIETEKYGYCGDKEKTCTKTNYRGLTGELLAQVYNVRTSGSNFDILRTRDADYLDFNLDGKIDAKDTDKDFSIIPEENYLRDNYHIHKKDAKTKMEEKLVSRAQETAVPTDSRKIEVTAPKKPEIKLAGPKVVLRNDRSNYPKEERPDYEAVLADAIKGYTRKEVKRYDYERPYAPAMLKRNKETKYFGPNDELLATVFNVRTMGKHNHNTISTPDADYTDWNLDGKIDCKDVDKEYDKAEIEAAHRRLQARERLINIKGF